MVGSNPMAPSRRPLKEQSDEDDRDYTVCQIAILSASFGSITVW